MNVRKYMRVAEAETAVSGTVVHVSDARVAPKRDRVRGVKWRTVKPDLDKLCRAVFDALTDAGVITDDARIVQAARKRPRLRTCTKPTEWIRHRER